MINTQPIIKVESLTKKFGSMLAVDSLSFTINKGEVVGFVGPNGAGKTTTISMFMGFLKSTKGTITMFGSDIRPKTAHKNHRQVGYVAGDMALFDNLTGEQYLSFLAHRYGNAERQKELIKRFQPKFGQKLKHLSRGNKQKIALTGAFQHNPTLVILDEPSSGLDPLMQEMFLNLIRDEQKKGTTVFMSSHILSEIALGCDRVMFMKQGKIMTDQPVKQLEEKAGKIVTINTTQNVLKQMFNQLPPKTKKLTHSTTSLKLRYDGDTNRLIRWLSSFSISDVSIAERDLDDIFHDMYKENDESSKEK